MILCNLNSFQLQYLNAIVSNPIFKEIMGVRVGDTSIIIEWADVWGDINIWEIDLAGNIELRHDQKTSLMCTPDWMIESERAARLESTVIDLDDEYMFEQYEAALED